MRTLRSRRGNSYCAIVAVADAVARSRESVARVNQMLPAGNGSNLTPVVDLALPRPRPNPGHRRGQVANELGHAITSPLFLEAADFSSTGVDFAPDLAAQARFSAVQ